MIWIDEKKVAVHLCHFHLVMTNYKQYLFEIFKVINDLNLSCLVFETWCMDREGKCRSSKWIMMLAGLKECNVSLLNFIYMCVLSYDVWMGMCWWFYAWILLPECFYMYIPACVLSQARLNKTVETVIPAVHFPFQRPEIIKKWLRVGNILPFDF